MRRYTALALSLVALAALAACEETPMPQPPPQPPADTAATPNPAPPAADPAPVTEGDVTIAYANGVKIIVKRIPGAELASLQLYIRGGARNWSAADCGVERMALHVAVEGGTESLDKDAFARRMAALGSNMGSDTRGDFSSIKAGALNAKWDDTFALMADAFMHPVLPPSEVEIARQRQLTALRREQESPDMELSVMTQQVLFKGHPFEHRSIGTPENVQKFDVAALKAHLAKLRETSRLVFVTAGDVDPAHVVEKVQAAFGSLPRGSYQETPFPGISFNQASVTVAEKKLPTNYLEGAFPGPGWRDADQADAMVAMSLLRFRLFEEVRTKRNLSYAPSAGLGVASSVPIGYLYVTAVDPNTTMKVMLDEARKLRDQPVSDKDLAGTKATYLTNYLMQNEAVDGQASMLGDAELLGGDWHLAKTLPERIRAVTAAGVQAYAKKYIAHLQMVALGDPAKVDKGIFGSL